MRKIRELEIALVVLGLVEEEANQGLRGEDTLGSVARGLYMGWGRGTSVGFRLGISGRWGAGVYGDVSGAERDAIGVINHSSIHISRGVIIVVATQCCGSSGHEPGLSRPERLSLCHGYPLEDCRALFYTAACFKVDLGSG